MIKSTLSTLATVAALAIATQASAAVITYAGYQDNVDPKETSVPATADSYGWRNPTPAKPLDINGDNIIGTDGYAMRGSTSLPAYITSVTNISGGGNNFGYMDNPADPTGVDNYHVGFWGSGSSSADLFSFKIQGTDLTGKTLGVAVQYDTYSSGHQTYTLAQTAGVGTDSVTTPALTIANDGYDWAFFYITGAVAGDTFKLSATKPASGAVNYLQWGGVAFDSAAVPEPASFALALAGFGMLGFRRQRNRMA